MLALQYVGCLLRSLRQFLCLRRRHVKHNAVIMQVKMGRRNSDFMLADAQEAADIGAQFGDLVVCCSLDIKRLSESSRQYSESNP